MPLVAGRSKPRRIVSLSAFVPTPRVVFNELRGLEPRMAELEAWCLSQRGHTDCAILA